MFKIVLKDVYEKNANFFCLLKTNVQCVAAMKNANIVFKFYQSVFTSFQQHVHNKKMFL